jgi:hypothetical protein
MLNPAPSFWMVDPDRPEVTYLATIPGAKPWRGRVTLTMTRRPSWSRVTYDITELPGVPGSSRAVAIMG